jgi:FkbM family methyltransferase
MRILIKSILCFFLSFVKNNKTILKYIYSKVLKEYTDFYVENIHLQSYPHIRKTIELIKILKIENFQIVDIGGANGFTALMFHNSFKNNNVIIFEPLSQNSDILNEITKKYNNIEYRKKALGSKSEFKNIFITKSITSSSILNPIVNEEYLQKKNIENIEVTTLDEEFKNQNKNLILKIDVQGYELEVLKGCKGSFDQIKIITVEVSNHDGYENSPKYHDIDKYLRENNFAIYDFYSGFRKNHKLAEWDVIYVNNNI